MVWLKIPSSYKKECELPFIKHAILKRPNTFQMLFINSLGNISQLNYNLEPEAFKVKIDSLRKIKHQILDEKHEKFKFLFTKQAYIVKNGILVYVFFCWLKYRQTMMYCLVCLTAECLHSNKHASSPTKK